MVTGAVACTGGIMRKSVLFFIFLFFPVFLFAQNKDKSSYREIGLQESSDIREKYAGTTQYYKSLAHFDYAYYNNVMGNLNVVVYLYPSQFTQLRYYHSQSLGIAIDQSQVVMLYYRHIINDDGFGQNRILDYIELVNNKYLIVGTTYTVTENLRLRSTADLSSKVIRTMQRGEFVTVTEEGKIETIDGITSAWAKVKLRDGAEGWCFGGYLGIRLKDNER